MSYNRLKDIARILNPIIERSIDGDIRSFIHMLDYDLNLLHNISENNYTEMRSEDEDIHQISVVSYTNGGRIFSIRLKDTDSNVLDLQNDQLIIGYQKLKDIIELDATLFILINGTLKSSPSMSTLYDRIIESFDDIEKTFNNHSVLS